MCGIIGIWKHLPVKDGNGATVFAKEENMVKKAVAGLLAMKNRGQDYSGLTNGKDVVYEQQVEKLAEWSSALSGPALMGHLLHAMVGCEPQPFVEKNSALVANCEIYNWKELNDRFTLHAKNDAHMLFCLLEKIPSEQVLPLLDGPFAFAYWKEGKVIVGRDLLGEKPVWFSREEGFSFASEKKALLAAGYTCIEELNPRHLLQYDSGNNELVFREQAFFLRTPEWKDSSEILKKKLQGLIIHAISKRIPDEKIGVLYSGGIDSLIIAKVLHDLGADFTCYVAAARENADDLHVARITAAYFGFLLKERILSSKDVSQALQHVVLLIEDSNAVKGGVGLAMDTALSAAHQDGIRVVYSGLGAEELFAGYHRHKKTLSSTQDMSMVNEDCLWGLRKLYERDLYRDDVLALSHCIELRLPYLDHALVDFSIKIPAQEKLKNGETKVILREVGELLGIPREFSRRKKIAAQYGGKFDKAIKNLAKKKGYSSRSQFLFSYYPHPNLRLGCLLSGGKDSNLALHLLKTHNYEISCLISIVSKNPDSYMFHTPAIELVRLQATALNIPLIEQESLGEKETELLDLKTALIKAKTAHHLEGIVSGAIASNYQRERIERIADELGLKVFCPLWHFNQETLLHELERTKFTFIMSAVAAEGLDETWLHKPIGKKEREQLIALNKQIGLNIAGEGGEYESLVIDGPDYEKKIVIDKFVIKKEGIAARMIITKAHLEKK